MWKVLKINTEHSPVRANRNIFFYLMLFSSEMLRKYVLHKFLVRKSITTFAYYEWSYIESRMHES